MGRDFGKINDWAFMEKYKDVAEITAPKVTALKTLVVMKRKRER